MFGVVIMIVVAPTFVYNLEASLSLEDFDFLRHLGGGRETFFIIFCMKHSIYFVRYLSLEIAEVFAVRKKSNQKLYAMKVMNVTKGY